MSVGLKALISAVYLCRARCAKNAPPSSLRVFSRQFGVVNQEQIFGVARLGGFVKLNEPVSTVAPSMTMILL